MNGAASAKFVDRDDFDADHYADCIRDVDRSRITLDQLDIATRHLRKTERFLSHIHDLKMKEHARVQSDFIRHVEQDVHIATLPSVKQMLKAQRRWRERSPPPTITIEHPQEMAELLTQQNNANNVYQHKRTIRLDTPKTNRLKANRDMFDKLDRDNPLLD